MVAAEFLVLIGALGLIGAVFVRGPKQKAAAFLGGFFVVAGTIFGGLAWAGIPAFVEIGPGDPPRADSLFTVSILSTSDTDRTETGEAISPDGHTITWTLTDVHMDALGDVNLDIRVTNANTGSVDDAWAFSAEITFVSTTTAGQTAQPIVNLTDFQTRYDVSYTETTAGAPTFTQTGDRAFSNDFLTGTSDQLNIDFRMNPTALDDVTSATPVYIRMLVGGANLEVQLVESG